MSKQQVLGRAYIACNIPHALDLSGFRANVAQEQNNIIGGRCEVTRN